MTAPWSRLAKKFNKHTNTSKCMINNLLPSCGKRRESSPQSIVYLQQTGEQKGSGSWKGCCKNAFETKCLKKLRDLGNISIWGQESQKRILRHLDHALWKEIKDRHCWGDGERVLEEGRGGVLWGKERKNEGSEGGRKGGDREGGRERGRDGETPSLDSQWLIQLPQQNHRLEQARRLHPLSPLEIWNKSITSSKIIILLILTKLRLSILLNFTFFKDIGHGLIPFPSKILNTFFGT